MIWFLRNPFYSHTAGSRLVWRRVPQKPQRTTSTWHREYSASIIGSNNHWRINNKNNNTTIGRYGLCFDRSIITIPIISNYNYNHNYNYYHRTQNGVKCSERGLLFENTLRYRSRNKAWLHWMRKEEPIQQDEKTFQRNVWLSEFLRTAQVYRRHFQPSLSQPEDLPLDLHDLSLSSKRIAATTTSKQLHKVFHGIHESESDTSPITLSTFQDSEMAFVKLYGTILLTSTMLCEVAPTQEDVKLAECLMQHLIRLREQRVLLIDAAKQFEDSQISSTRADNTDRPWNEGSNLFSNIKSYIFPGEDQAPSKWSTSLDVHESVAYNINDVLPECIISVLFHAMVNTIPKTNESSSYRNVSNKIMRFIDMMPTGWEPNEEIVVLLIQTLSRIATLEAARDCHKIYSTSNKRTNSLQLLFSNVLHAYLWAAHAAKKNARMKEMQSIADEALQLVQLQWRTRKPKLKIIDERIVDTSIVLQCLAIAASAPDSPREISDKANILAKQAISKDKWSKMMKVIYNESNCMVDETILPIVDPLLQIYALSGDKYLVEVGRCMLRYTMQQRKSAPFTFILFPTTEACNAVLEALWKRNCCIDSETSDPADSSFSKSDFTFFQHVVRCMHTRDEMDCWPNERTHALIQKILDASKEHNARLVAEQIIAMKEEKLVDFRNNEECEYPDVNKAALEAFNITQSSYHSVLEYILEEAQNGDRSYKHPSRVSRPLACTRALGILEKMKVHMPKRPTESFILEALYNRNIQPTRETYKLVLQICMETTCDPIESARIALLVCSEMMKRKIQLEDDTVQWFSTCLSRLSTTSEDIEEAQLRQDMEGLLQSIDIKEE